jgi:hypothetical protein
VRDGGQHRRPEPQEDAMQFRLGNFRIAGSGAVSVAERLQLARYLVELQRHLAATDPCEREQIEARLRELKRPILPASDPACLIESLPAHSPDREWLREAFEAMDEAHREGGRVELQACEAAEGPEAPIVVAAFARGRHAEVRRGDFVCAGFALRRAPDAELEVFPRLYRAVCANGAISPAGVLPARASRAGGLRAELKAMLGRRALEADVAALREAARTPVRDPLELLRSSVPRVDQSMQRRVRRDLAHRVDPSLWDLLNAVTALARELESWSARLDLERDAGGLLAVLPRPAPAHPLGLALQPPRADERLELHA